MTETLENVKVLHDNNAPTDDDRAVTILEVFFENDQAKNPSYDL